MLNSAEERLQALRVLDKEAARDGIDGEVSETSHFLCHSQGMLHVEDNEEEEFEIDINEQEPAFLKGQSTKNGGEVSPIKIVANPDGTLQVPIMLKSCS